MNRALRIAFFSLIFDTAYSAYHVIVGLWSASWWLFTVGVYYAILSVLRFAVLRSRKEDGFVADLAGVMLMLLSVPLVGTVILALVQDRGNQLHEIWMIAMAAFAFAKISVATVNLIKARRGASTRMIALRNISFADACVSIFTLQRSMLVSFGEMTAERIRLMNALTGLAVCLVVFLLGLALKRRKRELL